MTVTVNNPAVPEWWTSREAQIQQVLDTEVTQGQVAMLATSAGGRPVRWVAYGEPEPELRGQANFNSALGAREPDAFMRRGGGRRQRPVLVAYAGSHGQEMEGMVGALSIIRLMETGFDLRGEPRPRLREKLGRLRLLIVPLANPDGRARVPYDGFVGIDSEQMHRVGQGTRADGSLYGWPGCKAVHPMVGDVGFLGGYFDDAGVNLMHDEWPDPMSQTTRAIFELIRREGPDMLLNLHSYESPPGVLATHYVPLPEKKAIRAFAQRLYTRFAGCGLAHNQLPKTGQEGEGGGVPPALNFASLAYHCGAALSMTFESPHGLVGKGVTAPFNYEQILEIHHILFEAAADELLGEVSR